MAKKLITIGSMTNMHGYDSAAVSKSISVQDPIQILAAPIEGPDSLRLEDAVPSTSYRYDAITGNTVIDYDYAHVDVKTAGVTVGLPSVIGIGGESFIITNSSSGDVYVDPYGLETINGELLQTIPPDSSMNIIGNEFEWRIF